MAFEPGGRADKLGNRYEGRWVAKQLLRLLNEDIQSVTIEAVGDDEKGVDFAKHVIQSKAFTDSAFRLIYDLNNFKGSLIPCHPIILEICRVITTSLLESSKDYQSRFPYDLEQISPLLLRLYEQAIEENPGIANRCLDAWDTLYEHRVGFTRSLTQSIDK